MFEKREDGVIRIARAEWKKERKEKALNYFLLTLSILSISVLVLVLILHTLNITGFIPYLESQAGTITQLYLVQKFPVYEYAGVYGLALRVPGFTQQLFVNVPSGTIQRFDCFFDCIKSDAQGGPELFASTSPNLDLTGTITPATYEMIDAFNNCRDLLQCANTTFTERMTIYLGSTEISDIPATHTYKYDSTQNTFDIGALNVSGQLAFVTHITPTLQRGYNETFIVNYQMMLPTRENQTEVYYFYVDPIDTCPSGGLGNTIDASVYGYVKNSSGSLISDATVTAVGSIVSTDEFGFFNASFRVIPGTYNVIATKGGYMPGIENFTIDFSNVSAYVNITLNPFVNGSGTIHTVRFHGYVNDSNALPLSGVNISIGNGGGTTNENGLYDFNANVIEGIQPFIAIKPEYNNYYALLQINSDTTDIEHDLTMTLVSTEQYTNPTGPYTTQPPKIPPIQEIIEQIEKNGQDYWISSDKIKKEVRQGTFIQEAVSLYNFKKSTMQLVFSVSPELADFVKIDKSALTIPPGGFGTFTVTIFGTKPLGLYKGSLSIKGDIQQEIPAEITIVERKMPIESLLMTLDIFNKVVRPGASLRYKLTLQNLLYGENYKINLEHIVTDRNGTQIYATNEEEVEIKNALTLLRDIEIPQNLTDGEYVMKVNARYLNLMSSVSSPFVVARPIYLYSFFGIPLWLIFIFISVVSLMAFNVFLYKRHQEKKKRYHLEINYKLLPQPNERSIKIGKIAETNLPAYYNLDSFTTHGIVAGVTGGGKSIAAQTIVEEALMKNIAVIVFDPTAQWSGMLRKCDDKKMLSFYPKFGLKPSDARAFPGTVRQIKSAHQAIDIKKHMNPGQITVFTLNKIDPSEMDIFVAGVIASIFRSGPEEYPQLRLMLVFDEVHRLLPKFGGSGKGFLQIERACREFRKWGFGVLLVSQVLSDFVGEIKANINTEVQVRAAEESDLQRIKERYGEDAVRSLVRADVGTALIQNAEFNRGKPWFVTFRPILHNTRRLTDDILEKYNKYGDEIDDIDYQIEQLEQEKVDVFDLKMELKLVKDKLMTGNFTVVDIYLEGLRPRIEKQWQVLGKKPKKKEIETVSEAEVESSIKAAQSSRQTWQQQNPAQTSSPQTPQKKEDPKTKIVKPLTFNNGMMVSSAKELLDVLPTLENDVYAEHVNEQKNDIVAWISKEIDPKLGDQLKNTKDKETIIKVVSNFFKPPTPVIPAKAK